MAHNQMIRQEIEELINVSTNTVRSLCLFGPKNIGKESLVIDIASRYGLSILPVSSSSLIRGCTHVMEHRQVVRSLLQKASELSPCFLIFTDFHLLFTSR